MKKGHKVVYEWLAELVLTANTEDYSAGTIMEVTHFVDAKQLKRFMEENPPDEGYKYDFGIVRDVCDDLGSVDGRSWAYIVDGAIPTRFEDAYQNAVHLVPKHIRLQFMRAWGRSADAILVKDYNFGFAMSRKVFVEGLVKREGMQCVESLGITAIYVKDGCITLRQFHNALKRLGVTEEEASCFPLTSRPWLNRVGAGNGDMPSIQVKDGVSLQSTID